jgi:outer membrane protein insertion porin family
MNYSKFLKLLFVLGSSCITVISYAAEGFSLKEIRIEGLQRIETGTVFSVLPFRIGDTYTEEKGANALRALFSLGEFSDIRLKSENQTLIITVQERKLINSVEFKGNHELSQEALSKALKNIGIAEGQPFDKALADRAEQELKREYLSRSLYSAEITASSEAAPNGRINILFTINEGEKTKIKQIRIIGAKGFTEKTLIEQMDLSTGNWLSWYTKADQYSRSKLNADLETLRAYYLNRGYLEFNIISTQVTVSPDRKNIFIHINIKEGPKYIVTAVRMDGDYLGRDEDFKSLIKIKPGKIYNAEEIEKTTKKMAEQFGYFGFAFAKIDVYPELDRKKGQVLVRLHAEPQRRVYVRRINISGNNKTRDEVIRREFRQFESSWFDGRRIKLSRDRVDRLGYFNTVNVDTQEVSGSTDQVDLMVTVEEKSTGSLMLGASYSSAEKLAFSAGIKMDNIFGSGNYFGLELNTSKSNKTVVLSTVDPYFTDNGISRAIDLYYKTTQPLNSQGEEYKLITPGISVKFGIPFTELDTVYFGAGLEQTSIKGSSSLPNYYFTYREKYGETNTSVPITVGWSRDSRDSALAPTDGIYQRLNIEWSGAADTRYLRSTYQFQKYWPLGKKYTLLFNTEGGWGHALNDQEYPVFKNYFGGGLGSVRGFDQGSMGPVDLTGAYIGGNRKLNLNTELYVPFPGAGNDKSLRIFGFIDAGNIWGEKESVELDSLRASGGIGLSWISPVGPLRLSWGKPFRSFPQDKLQKFQFQIGTAF